MRMFLLTTTIVTSQHSCCDPLLHDLTLHQSPLRSVPIVRRDSPLPETRSGRKPSMKDLDQKTPCLGLRTLDKHSPAQYFRAARLLGDWINVMDQMGQPTAR